MKLLLLIFYVLFSQIVLAQSFADLTVVAVGDAQEENENYIVLYPEFVGNNLSPIIKNKAVEFIEIIRNDLSFYRSKININKELVKDFNNKQTDYLIISSLKKENSRSLINIQVKNLVSAKVIFEYSEKLNFSNLRDQGHQVATVIFKTLGISDKDPIFSKKIVFVSDKTSRGSDTKKELYIMDFDGKRVKRLTYRNSLIISPAVSHDGEKVLYTVIESKWKKSSSGKVQKVQNLNLYEQELGTRKSRLISSLDGINSGAIYTKDDSSIYLTLTPNKNADIYKINLKTKKRQQITKSFAEDVDPSVTADESKMTFLSSRSGKAMIYTLDLKDPSAKAKRISYVGKFNASPRFSPDGREITFASWLDNQFDIFRIDSSGNNLVRLTKNFGSNEEPMFSEDGEFIIFSSQRVFSQKRADQDIYIMNREGQILSRLTNRMGRCFTPRWVN